MAQELSPKFLDIVNALYKHGHDDEAEAAITYGMISAVVNRRDPIDIFRMSYTEVMNLIRFNRTSKARPFPGNWSTNVWGKDYV